MEDSELPS
jgi:hypothetical protein